MNALTTQNGSFQVPATGTAGLPYYGQTTLRVRETFGTPNMDACAGFTYGEAERLPGYNKT